MVRFRYPEYVFVLNEEIFVKLVTKSAGTSPFTEAIFATMNVNSARIN